MAIFGIGADWGEKNVSSEFLNRGIACIGWPEDENPPSHAILRRINTGDILFMKAFSPQIGLIIKAVGLVTSGRPSQIDIGGQLFWGIEVRWVWQGDVRIGQLDDKWPVRWVTIYEEYHPVVQAKVIELLLSRMINNALA